MAQLGGVPDVRGGSDLVPGGAPRLHHHAPVPPGGQDELHQLADDGVLPLLHRDAARLHRLHRCRRVLWGSFGAGGGVGVWVPRHVPDGH